VGSYVEMLETWNSKIHFMRIPNAYTLAHDLPSRNPAFWNTIEPYRFLDFILSPVQLQHAQGDTSVPVELSRSLNSALVTAGKKAEYFEYPGDNHNINRNFTVAWNRTIKFFKDNL
jgi:dipeptidyl aminopeptidase/acylaminoacyl peptidase